MRLWFLVMIFCVGVDAGFRVRRRRRSCGAVNGGWSGWGGWSSCSCNHATGTGTWTRSRSCNSPAPSCGGSGCPGSSRKTGSCNDQCCQITNGAWSAWGSWSSCLCDLNTGTGIWTRSRTCNNPSPSCGGSSCPGSATESGSCDDQCCKTVHGGFSDWSSWGTCTCNHADGTGTRSRSRSCTNPAPSCNGNVCVGETIEVGSCDDQCCQTVDGGLTAWGDWSICDCDHSTGTGTRSRTRSCTNPAPSCHGRDCDGDLVESGSCDDQCCQTVDGGLTPWGQWSPCKCNQKTGTGTRSRIRSCTNPAPSCHGRECDGDLVENGSCNDQCWDGDSSECKDKKPVQKCQLYASSSRDYCTLARKWMMKHCKASCGFCPATCDRPEIVDGKLLPDSSTVLIGGTYKVTCNKGYVISGSETITCQENGQLSELPRCMPVTCGKPEIVDGTVFPDAPTITVGEAYKAICNAAFAIAGSEIMTCQENGELSELPHCLPDEFTLRPFSVSFATGTPIMDPINDL